MVYMTTKRQMDMEKRIRTPKVLRYPNISGSITILKGLPAAFQVRNIKLELLAFFFPCLMHVLFDPRATVPVPKDLRSHLLFAVNLHQVLNIKFDS